MKEQARYEILYEAMNGKLDTIAEGVNLLKDVPSQLTRIEEKLDKLDVTSQILDPVVNDHRLEQKVFD